jgi:monovalent cation:H+ antiporter, CPA1 family
VSAAIEAAFIVMNLSIEFIASLLLIAAIVAMAVRRLKIPYTVGLMLTGIVLAISPFPTDDVEITKDMIFTIFLPPLIYEAAIYIKWQEVRRDLPVILTLAIVGVLLSAGVTALGMHYLAQWGWPSALLFGVLIAATDPVSVIATFKEAGVQGRLRLLVETESLFNDGAAAVAFSIALAFTMGGSITVFGTAQTLVIIIAGGILCGALVAGTVLLLAGRTDDHLIEITLTMVAAYGSFLLAEHFHLSGVLASLVAGLLTGNFGSLGSFSDKGREAVLSFWEFIAFMVNSLIFMLIGIGGAYQNFAHLLLPIMIALLMMFIGRALAIYPLSALFSRSALQISPNHQHVLFWGGLRGALALALALGLPPEFPQRESIITVSFAVVGYSICVQGLSMVALLRKLKEIP